MAQTPFRASGKGRYASALVGIMALFLSAAPATAAQATAVYTGSCGNGVTIVGTFVVTVTGSLLAGAPWVVSFETNCGIFFSLTMHCFAAGSIEGGISAPACAGLALGGTGGAIATTVSCTWMWFSGPCLVAAA